MSKINKILRGGHAYVEGGKLYIPVLLQDGKTWIVMASDTDARNAITPVYVVYDNKVYCDTFENLPPYQEFMQRVWKKVLHLAAAIRKDNRNPMLTKDEQKILKAFCGSERFQDISKGVRMKALEDAKAILARLGCAKEKGATSAAKKYVEDRLLQNAKFWTEVSRMNFDDLNVIFTHSTASIWYNSIVRRIAEKYAQTIIMTGLQWHAMDLLLKTMESKKAIVAYTDLYQGVEAMCNKYSEAKKFTVHCTCKGQEMDTKVPPSVLLNAVMTNSPILFYGPTVHISEIQSVSFRDTMINIDRSILNLDSEGITGLIA